MVSGICFGTGLFHLFIGLRRQGADMVHFTFGLFALAYSGAVLTGLLMYRSATLPQYLMVDRWSGLFAGVTYIFLIWFVAVYTGVQPMPLLAGLTVLFGTLITAHITRPTLIHGQIMGIATLALPWGEQITFLEAAESGWEILFILTQLLTIGFLFYACIRQYRRGEQGAALALGAGVLFFVASIIFDMLIESGVINFVLASDFAFFGLAIVMSLRISNDRIHTEEELAYYHHNLEVMVEERTEELQHANEQLAHEVASRMQTEEALQGRVEELAGLNRIANTLTSVIELPAALEQISGAVADLFAAQHVYIMLPSGQKDALQIMVGFQQGSGTIGAMPLPVPVTETPFFNQVLSQAESLTISDVQALPLAAPMREFVVRQRIQSAMLVPLVVRGSAIGLLAIATDHDGWGFTADHIRLAETVAGEVAGAIENVRLFEQAQAAAVSDERGRIARDLHDSVTQSIYSASLIAEALPGVWKRNPDQVQGSLTTLLQLIRGALAEMRTLLFELRPAALEESSLGRLLNQLADVLTGRTRIPVEVTVQGSTDLPVNVKTALYRIAQEAFNNIVKHAKATRVTAILQDLPDRVVLTVQDDGIGFDSESIPAEHLGLRIMRERAQNVGAKLVVTSELGRGTEVRVEWRKDEA